MKNREDFRYISANIYELIRDYEYDTGDTLSALDIALMLYICTAPDLQRGGLLQFNLRKMFEQTRMSKEILYSCMDRLKKFKYKNTYFVIEDSGLLFSPYVADVYRIDSSRYWKQNMRKTLDWLKEEYAEDNAACQAFKLIHSENLWELSEDDRFEKENADRNSKGQFRAKGQKVIENDGDTFLETVREMEQKSTILTIESVPDSEHEEIVEAIAGYKKIRESENIDSIDIFSKTVYKNGNSHPENSKSLNSANSTIKCESPPLTTIHNTHNHSPNPTKQSVYQ